MSDVAPPAALGICLVGYSYLVALWGNRHNATPDGIPVIREWVNIPLGIGEDFGFFGIALLLIGAGYVVSAASATCSMPRLAIAVILRAGLPAVLTLSLAVALIAAGGEPLTDPVDSSLTPAACVAGLLLAAPVSGHNALLGLGWVLTVAAIFVLLCIGTVSLIRRPPWLIPALHLAALSALVLTATHHGGWYQQLGRLASFGTLPLFGQLLWLHQSGRLSAWPANGFGLGCLALLIYAERTYSALAGWGYPLTAVYTALLSLVTLAGPRWLHSVATIRWLCTRAYSLFLMTGVLGYASLGALTPYIPQPAAFLVAVITTCLSAELSYRLVELPGRKLLNTPRGSRIPVAGRESNR